jgi:hypothetical protein
MGCGSSKAPTRMPGSSRQNTYRDVIPNEAVFTAVRYQAAWKQLEGTPEAALIERHGLVLKQSFNELHALLIAFLFNPANQDEHPDYGLRPLLSHPKAAAARKPMLDRLILLKKQALPLIDQVDACIEQAYASMPGEPAPIAAPQSGATQPIPECFEGLSLHDEVSNDQWSPEMSAVLEAAARMVSSGEHAMEVVHIDASDRCWLRIKTALERDKEITPLMYLLAKHLTVSARFHTQMHALLSPYGEYRAVRMKTLTQCTTKTSHKGSYGAAALKAEGLEVRDPLCRHLKDVLRCTLVLADHGALGKAHAALLAEHAPVGTKDRRLLPSRWATHGRMLLQTVWFEGLIVEVQFHFAPGARRSMRP